MNDVIFHGETIMVRVDSIPENETVKKAKTDYVVVGASETQGNDHRVDTSRGVAVLESPSVTYFQVEEPTRIYCPNSSKHADVAVPVGKWAVHRAVETELNSEILRRIAD